MNKDETKLIDLATGERRGLRAWLVRRRLTLAERTELAQTQALFRQLQAHSTEAAPEPPEFPLRNRKGVPMKRLALPTVAVVALCTLSTLPFTGWLVRSQLQVALGGGLDRLGIKWLEQQHDDRGVAERSGDPQLLLAATPKTHEALTTLAQRFPHDAAIQGTLTQLHKNPLGGIAQPDGRTPWTPGPDSPLPPTPAIASLLQDCERGAAIAPDNGFFPTLHTYALFAAGRPRAALQQLHIAAQKAHWENYNHARIEAAWALDYVLNGETGATARLAHLASATANDFPPMALTRQVARSASAFATGLEKAGKEREALAIREDLLKLGYTMQTDGSTMVTNLVGGAVAGIAVGRHREAFQAQAKRLGRPDVAALAERQYTELTQLKKGFEAYFNSGKMLTGMERAFWWQGAALLALLGVLWTILFGGIAHVLARTGRIRRRERLHSAVGWGLVLGIALPPLVVFGIETFPTFGGALLGGAGALCITAGFFLRNQPLRNLGIVALTILSTLGLAAVAALLLNGPAIFTKTTAQALLPTTTTFDDAPTETPETVTALQGLALGALSLALPLITILGLAISGWVKRVPASVQVVRGFRRSAIPTASVVLLVYTGLVVVAAQLDAKEREKLALQVKHEGRAFVQAP